MARYAIVRDGRDFIVQSDEQSVLKCASRREAAKAVADAKGLMREDNAQDRKPDKPPETRV